MIKTTFSTNFKATLDKLKKYSNPNTIREVLHKYGKLGVIELSKHTPIDTGKTSRSWEYVVRRVGKRWTLYFINTNKTPSGDSIAVIILYGHMTKRGRWVDGVNYLDPALGPLFEELENKIWKELL